MFTKLSRDVEDRKKVQNPKILEMETTVSEIKIPEMGLATDNTL